MTLERLRKKLRISKGYQDYTRRGDIINAYIGKRLYLAILPNRIIKRWFYILDIDFCYNSREQYWLEIVFLGIGFSCTKYKALDSAYTEFVNNYKR